ncbi:toxin-antitoxin system HicB family antitoxin [Thermoactinospora rubra]|uniref:toxin-antitoxin system HicB family antitoxin n=1 Tax=Thermoactinospora rubra TaxID=1088767 RepID=UPI000A10F2C3|nr:toxin-antitoxin system HicB family antitoxin [Thermoactinospora rubra]
MELTTYIDGLRRELSAAAEIAGPEAGAAADRLTSALEAAVRLTLLEVLSDAADEVTRQIEPGVVEVRIRGREPQLVVTAPPAGHSGFPSGFPPGVPLPPEPPAPPSPPGEGEPGTARMTLRLPESLKARIEQAASNAGMSVNAWLVRALTFAVSEQPPPGMPPGKRLTGWAR